MLTTPVINLLAKRFAGEATDEEEAALQEWLLKNPQMYDRVKLLQKYWDYKENTDIANVEVALHKVLSQIDDEKNSRGSELKFYRKSRVSAFYKYAAALIAAVVISVVVWNMLNKNRGVKNESIAYNTGVKNEMITPKGSRSKIILADSTVVYLNADSKLSYTKDFNQANREVALIGEAFFEVKHDAAHPFIIHSGKAMVKVLGTSFNVRNYPNEKFLETSLIKGRVEVTIEDQPDKKVILNPSEKLILSKNYIGEQNKIYKTGTEDAVLKITHVTLKDNVVIETAWMQNKIAFMNKPLYDITSELEKQFNIDVIYKTPATKNIFFTIYLENYDLQEVMEILKMSGKINYTINGKQVIIE